MARILPTPASTVPAKRRAATPSRGLVRVDGVEGAVRYSLALGPLSALAGPVSRILALPLTPLTLGQLIVGD